MISAKDLQIGDWVFCTYPSINKPARVAEIKTVGDNKLKIVIYDDDIRLVFNETYIDPIPLTPEILEKNFPTYEGLAWKPSDMTGTIPAFTTIRIDEDFAHIEIDLLYVHELQHALRLCWIDADIVI